MRVLKTLFLLVLLAGLIGGLVFYNRQITDFSRQFLSTQEGDKALLREDWNLAMAIFEEAYRKDSHNPDIALKLAKIDHRQANYYAEEGYVDYWSAGPQRRARRKTVDDMREEAETLFRKAIQGKARALEPRLAYGEYLQEDPRRLGEALALYREALRHHPDNPTLLGALGDLYKAAAENPDEDRPAVRKWLDEWSIYYYRMALRKNPAQFRPRFNLGVLYQLREPAGEAQKSENLTKAVREYCNALLISPRSYETRYNLGLALVDMEAIEAGFRQLSRAVNLLVEDSRMAEAQQLAQQIQGVKNSIYYEDRRQYQLQVEDLEPWVQSCLAEEKAPSGKAANR